MGNSSSRSDNFDQALAGKLPAGEDGFDDMAAFVRGVRNAYLVAPEPTVTRRHLVAIREEARLVASPASKAARQASGPKKWKRRRLVFGSLFASLTAKLVAGAALAAAATGGAAAAGVLPDPAQQVVADAAVKIGIVLRNPASEAKERQDAEHRRDSLVNPEPVNDEVQDAIENTEPGPERGDAVSDAADSNRQDENAQSTQGNNPSDTPSSGKPTENGQP